jgi:hypothetical protein
MASQFPRCPWNPHPCRSARDCNRGNVVPAALGLYLRMPDAPQQRLHFSFHLFCSWQSPRPSPDRMSTHLGAPIVAYSQSRTLAERAPACFGAHNRTPPLRSARRTSIETPHSRAARAPPSARPSVRRNFEDATPFPMRPPPMPGFPTREGPLYRPPLRPSARSSQLMKSGFSTRSRTPMPDLYRVRHRAEWTRCLALFVQHHPSKIAEFESQ